jgi:hypothetical protein
MRAPTVDPHKTALVLAALFGGWHLIWSVLVLAGWAQPVIDFVFWMHFLRPVYVVEPFAIGRSLILIGVTAGIGGTIGYGFAWLWNRIHG